MPSIQKLDLGSIERTACYTDIHLGRKNNSDVHNQDCLDYMQFFADNVKADQKISHIAFLGDFFENRANINISTLNYAYEALEIIDDLDIPIIHIVGNHDLFKRESRDIHSVRMFKQFKNIHVVDTPTMIDKSLFSPFLFSKEYPDMVKSINSAEYVYGHFEFKGFMITGYNTVMERGPEHSHFNGPKKILSGHFHKRQVQDNVAYIGNTFCMDHGDAGDTERGMAICDHGEDSLEFINYKDQPNYEKVKMSEIDGWEPKIKSHCRCMIDVDITYSEANDLKDYFINEFNMREFLYEDSADKTEILEETEVEELSGSTNEMMLHMLKSIEETDTIKNTKLVSIYEGL